MEPLLIIFAAMALLFVALLMHQGIFGAYYLFDMDRVASNVYGVLQLPSSICCYTTSLR